MKSKRDDPPGYAHVFDIAAKRTSPKRQRGGLRAVSTVLSPRLRLGVVFLLTAMVSQSAFAGKPLRYEFESVQMGVPVRLVLYSNDAPTAEKAAAAAFERFAELNAVMSDYDSDSELSRLSLQGGEDGEPVPVSEDLFAVLEAAKRYSTLSDGAFDVTVGPYVRLWRRARRQRELPKERLVEQARQRVGNHLWELDKQRRAIVLRQRGMRFDLGGIAKGYAIDRAFETIREHGITVQLVDAGGDMRLGDAPPAGWRVEMNDGVPLSPEKIALATSGDRFRFLEIDGVRYSHIIDPKTGLGLTTRGVVYVTASTATEADALASALSVMEPEKGIKLAESLEGVAAKIVLDEGRRVFQTRNWPESNAKKPGTKRSAVAGYGGFLFALGRIESDGIKRAEVDTDAAFAADLRVDQRFAVRAFFDLDRVQGTGGKALSAGGTFFPVDDGGHKNFGKNGKNRRAG